MAMARGAYFIWNFQGGDSCTFSQGFRRFSENLRLGYGGHPGTKWRVVYMGNCTHFHVGPGSSIESSCKHLYAYVYESS